MVVRGPYNVLHATSLGIEGETKDKNGEVRLNVLGLNPRNGNTWSSKISSKGQLENNYATELILKHQTCY